MTRQNTTDTKGQTRSRSLAKRATQTPSLLDVSPMGTSPFGIMRRLMDDMDQIFGDFGFGRSWVPSLLAERQLTQTTWLPDIEVFERDGKLVVRADLPGLKKDDIQIYLQNDQLILEGERRYEHDETKAGLYRSERSYGRFYRSIAVPDGTDPDSINASMDNGVLEVTVKLPEERRRGRRIEIKEGKGEQTEVH